MIRISVGTVFPLLTIAVFFVPFSLRDAVSPSLAEDMDDAKDAITDDSAFLRDWNAIETATIHVEQPAGAVIEEGRAYVDSDETWFSHSLDEKSQALGVQLLKDVVRKYPLKRSFRSIQEDWLIAPVYAIGFFRKVDDRWELLFKIDLYGDFLAEYAMEIKHKKGGTVVRNDREMVARAYRFFAQAIEPEHPETARVLRTIARTEANEAESEEAERIPPRLLPPTLVVIVVVALLSLWRLLGKKKTMSKRGRS